MSRCDRLMLLMGRFGYILSCSYAPSVSMPSVGIFGLQRLIKLQCVLRTSRLWIRDLYDKAVQSANIETFIPVAKGPATLVLAGGLRGVLDPLCNGSGDYFHETLKPWFIMRPKGMLDPWWKWASIPPSSYRTLGRIIPAPCRRNIRKSGRWPVSFSYLYKV